VGDTSHLRIRADAVPPAGYKVFEIRPGPGEASREPAASVESGVLEHEAVRLVLERDGAIRSLVDKRRGGVELAAESDGLKLNDFARRDRGWRTHRGCRTRPRLRHLTHS